MEDVAYEECGLVGALAGCEPVLAVEERYTCSHFDEKHKAFQEYLCEGDTACCWVVWLGDTY